MFRIVVVLCLGLSFSMSIFASPLSEARELLMNGQKREAWQILYPVAQNAGQGEAKFLLGHLLLTSPDIEDHLKKALLYFKAARSDGYSAADQVINATEQRIETMEQASIAQERNSDLYERNARDWRAYTKKVRSGFITPEGDVVPHQLSVFVKGGNSITANVEDIVRSTPNLLSELQVKYYLVLDREEMGKMDIFPPGFSPPPGGFQPDFDGEQAKSFEVTSYPAIVLQTSKSSQPRIITLPQLRSWAENWSR